MARRKTDSQVTPKRGERLLFTYSRIIRMQDTDATGGIYFPNLLAIAVEAFEKALDQANFSLQKMVQEKQILLPVVHVEANLFAPIFLRDLIEVRLGVKKRGLSSFSLSSEFFKENKKVASALVVHATYSEEKKRTIPLPTDLKKILDHLRP